MQQIILQDMRCWC